MTRLLFRSHLKIYFSSRYVQLLWSLEIAETHVGRSHSSAYGKCSADLTVSYLQFLLLDQQFTISTLGTELLLDYSIIISFFYYFFSLYALLRELGSLCQGRSIRVWCLQFQHLTRPCQQLQGGYLIRIHVARGVTLLMSLG